MLLSRSHDPQFAREHLGAAPKQPELYVIASANKAGMVYPDNNAYYG